MNSWGVVAIKRNKKIFLKLIVVILLGLTAATSAQLLVNQPVRRSIHIRNFRYGKDPSVIRCNRGDTLELTFSSDDTGHSFFLEEFNIDAKVSPGDHMITIFKTSDPTAQPFIGSKLVFIASHPGMWNYLISKSAYRCHVWCGPMHAFEQGKIIIMPNTLLFFSLGCFAGIILFWIYSIYGQSRNSITGESSMTDILKRFPWLRKLVASRWPQIILMLLAFVLIYIVIITAIFGTKVSGRNLGVLLMWAVWLFFLIVILTPWGGRIWCTVCPLPVIGDWLQRGSFFLPRKGQTGNYRNVFSGLFLKWPVKLDNNWLKLIVFLTLATFSTTLVASPRISGLTVLALMVAPAVMSLIWELRSFCRYLCPVSLFVGPFSGLSPLSLRNMSQSVCDQCRSKSCENGNSKGWACPYGLNAGTLKENSECGLCLECIRSCSYNNVTLYTRPFATEKNSVTWSGAWMTIAIFSMAMIYSILYLGPWPIVRDFVNILDKKNWGLFGIFSLILWTLVLVIIPGIYYFLIKLILRSGQQEFTVKEIFLKSTSSLLPAGLFTWMSFVIPMLFVNVTFIKQSFSDPFGWGWNLFNEANTPWHQFLPEFIPWIQAGLILIGFSYSLRNICSTWQEYRLKPGTVLKLSLPAGILVTSAVLFMLVFFTN